MRGRDTTSRAMGTLGAVAVVSLGVLAATPASASEADEGPIIVGGDSDDVEVEDLDDAEREDLERVAEDEGVTVEEAAHDVAWQEDFSRLADELREDFPDEFAGAWIEDGDGADAWVAFAGAAPDEALEAAAAFSRPLAVHEGRGYTEAELDEELESIHYELLDDTDAVEDVMSSHDLATGRIEVEVEPAEMADDADTVDQLATRMEPSNTEISLEMEASSELDYANEAIYGGGDLTTCTSGFVVNDQDSARRGVTTAAHCQNSQSYEGAPLDFEGSHRGSFGDVQWHRHTSRAHVNEFYSTSSTRRAATSVAGLPEGGQSINNYGKNSGRDTETVYRTNVCQGDDCRLIAMGSHVTTGGDSGGPWFWANTAHGIHKGYRTIDGERRSTFSQARWLPSALGVEVATD